MKSRVLVPILILKELSLFVVKLLTSSLVAMDTRFYFRRSVLSLNKRKGDPELIFLTDGASPGVQAW